MRLTNTEFAEVKKLQKLVKSGKASDSDKSRLEDLLSKKKNSGNDPEFYLPTEQAKHDFAEFYQNLLQGINIKSLFSDVALGGVCVLYYHKVTDSEKSAVNGISLAARDFYQWIRSGQSGATNYQGVDIELYLQGVCEIVDMLEILKRFYRLANTYDRLSVTWPAKVFYAITGNYTFLPSLIANMADFRGRINQMCRMVSSFNFPGDLPYVKVRKHLSSNIFVEKDDNARTQIFIYMPASYLQYNETKYTTGGCLERKGMSWQFVNYGAISAFMDTLENMIATFKASNTNTTMNGDIYRKYEKENMLSQLYVYSELHDLEAIVPMYDKHILERIRNSTIIGEAAFGDIVQEDNCIWSIIQAGSPRKFGSNTQTRFALGINNTIIPNSSFGTLTAADWTDLLHRSGVRIGSAGVRDFGFSTSDTDLGFLGEFVCNYDEVPDVNMVIESTRHLTLCGGYDYSTDSGNDYYNPKLTHGSEIIISVKFVYSNDSAVQWGSFDNNNLDLFGPSDLIQVSHFAYHPVLHYASGIGTVYVPALPVIDMVDTNLENFGLYQYAQIRNLNKQILITEFSSATVTNLMSRLTGK